MEREVQEAVRVDRWLWAARFFKSRSLASRACQGGKVSVNGSGARAHKSVRAGDLVEVTLGEGRRRLRVVALAKRRGPAAEARLLYEDLTPPPPPRDAGAITGGARPTKRERRHFSRVRGW